MDGRWIKFKITMIKYEFDWKLVIEKPVKNVRMELIWKVGNEKDLART